MKNNIVKIGLSKRDDMPTLYSYLVYFEKDLKDRAGSFNIMSQSFIDFCKSNDIKCKGSIAKSELDKKYKTKNYFFFSVKYNTVSKKDHAHHLLRHIRNSIAHALISKERGYYILTDKNSNNNLSMSGKIKIDLFESIINELIKTSSN